MSAFDKPPLWGSAAIISKTGLTATIWSTFAVATIFLSVRLVLRWRHNSRFLLDDYCIIFAWLCYIVQSILQTWQLNGMWYVTYLDFGHISDTDPARDDQAGEMARWHFPVTALFWTVLWSVKASVLITFYKLVHPIWWLRQTLYAVAAFTFLSYVICYAAYEATRESPHDTYVLETPVSERQARASVIYATTVDISSDLMIAALPMNIIPSLHLPRSQKCGIGATFALGLLIVAVAIVRMTQAVCGSGVDHVGVALWSAVETATAIVVGSLLSLGGLWTRGIKKHSRRSTGVSNYTGPSKGSSAHWSHSSRPYGSQGSRKAATLASDSDGDFRADPEDAECSPGDERPLYIRKTVETDVSSEYGKEGVHDNAEVQAWQRDMAYLEKGVRPVRTR